jgi:hypothetical protein
MFAVILQRDQEMTRGNLALARSQMSGNPIRVIRGFQLRNKYSPHSGYRYDGNCFLSCMLQCDYNSS